MPITAFSQSLNTEIDALNYAKLKGHDVLSDPSLKNITDHLKSTVRQDVTCSSCGAKYPIIVSGGIRKKCQVTQPHFRFTDEAGNENHHADCEFHSAYPTGRLSDYTLGENRKSKQDITQLISELTSRAIASGAISKLNMKEFRGWFFELRKKGAIDVTVSLSEIEAYRKIHSANRSLLSESAYEANYFGLSNKKLEYILIKKRHVLFDPRKLGDKYRSIALLFSDFRLGFNSKIPKATRVRAASAFLGLILFSSGWCRKKATKKLKRLFAFQGPVIKDANIVGFNPFSFFSENWAAIVISEASRKYDLMSILEKIKKETPNSPKKIIYPEVPLDSLFDDIDF